MSNNEKLVDYIVTCGASRSEATMIVDLAKNADEKAVDSIALACKVGPTTFIQQAAFTAALRFLQVNIGESFGEKPDNPPAYPTEDAYMAAARAGHWRTAQLRAHGIEPLDLTKVANLTQYPPDDFDWKAAEAAS
jgi:hypothetical protein